MLVETKAIVRYTMFLEDTKFLYLFLYLSFLNVKECRLIQSLTFTDTNKSVHTKFYHGYLPSTTIHNEYKGKGSMEELDINTKQTTTTNVPRHIGKNISETLILQNLSNNHESNKGPFKTFPVHLMKEPIAEVESNRCTSKSCLFLGLSVICTDEVCGTSTESCYCDLACVLFGDCCLEEIIRSKSETELYKLLENPLDWYAVHTTTVSKNYTKIIYEYSMSSICLSFLNDTDELQIRVIQGCPEHYSNKVQNYSAVKRLCEGDSEAHRFVSLNLNSEHFENETQIIFRNKQCAICNGYEDSEVVAWSIRSMKDNSSLYFPPTGVGKIRKCNRKFYTDDLECKYVNNKQINRLKDICHLYISSTHRDNTSEVVKNPHCLQCKLHADWKEQNETNSCLAKFESTGMIFGSKPSIHVAGIGSLFSLNFLPPRHNSAHTVVLHPLYQDTNPDIYLQCQHGFHRKGRMCIKTAESIFPRHKYKDTNIYVVKITLNKEDNDFKSINSTWCLTFLSSEMLWTSDVFEYGMHSCSFRINENNWNHTASGWETLKRCLMYLLPGINKEIFMTNDKTGYLNCNTDQTMLMARDIELMVENNTLYATGISGDYAFPLVLSNFALNMFISDQMNFTIDTLSYCSFVTNEYLNSSFQQSYRPGEYLIQNGTVTLKDVELDISPYFQEYMLINNTLHICVVQNTDIESTGLFRTIARYVNVICMSISVVSLCLLIYIHLAIPQLLNLHGKIVVGFSSSLAFTHALYVTTMYLMLTEVNKDSEIRNNVCKVFGILQHYLWISTFVWNSIMSYDICRRFSVCSSLKQQIDIDQGRFRFRVYAAVACILPCIVVIISNIASVTGTFTLGYGDSDVCMVSSLYGRLYAFDVPIFVTYISTLIFFLVALHGLERSRRMTKQLTQTSQRYRKRCLTYTKISLMIGVVWTVVFVSVFTHSFVFGLLSTFLGGLQGFLMLIGFLLNSKVRRLVKLRFSCTTTLKDCDKYEVYNV